MPVLKRTSLPITVAFLIINSVFTPFLSCCERGEELFPKHDVQSCCICCNNAQSSANKTFFTTPARGKTQTNIDDCDSCFCISYASNADNYFISIKRTIAPFHFLRCALTTPSADNVHIKHSVFSPTVINQKSDCLSTVVLLI